MEDINQCKYSYSPLVRSCVWYDTKYCNHSCAYAKSEDTNPNSDSRIVKDTIEDSVKEADEMLDKIIESVNKPKDLNSSTSL